MSKIKKLKKQLKKLEKALAAQVAAAAAVPPVLAPVPWATYDVVSATAMKKADAAINPFDVRKFHKPAPGVVPASMKNAVGGMAMDSAVIEINAWSAQQVYNNAYFNGQTFLGYTYLAELAQRPEYRKPAEALATESTRKWIKLKSKSNDTNKADRIKQLEGRLEKFDVQAHFRKMSEYDSFMGRMHLYVDIEGTADNDELMKESIGDGSDDTTLGRFKGKTNFIKDIRPIEPVWCYPGTYNSTNPLAPHWYNPQTWYVMGKEVHKTRLLCFVAREVPDLLKPSYQFGGLSLSQMAKPYIDNWLRTRQAVADLVWTFSTMILQTDTAVLTQPGSDLLMRRLQVFANLRTNQGLMVLNKDAEDLKNVSVPLSTLDALQAQSQEQMCSVTNTPVVKLLGIQPAGLNASSEGELTVWYDWTSAYQEKFYDPHLTTIINLLQYDLWGQLDPDIVHEWEPIAELTEEQAATVQKTLAETDSSLITAGTIDPDESRERLTSDPNSPYFGKLHGDAPGPPQQPGMEDGGMPGMPGELPDDGSEDDLDPNAGMAMLFPRLMDRSRVMTAREEGRREERAGREGERREGDRGPSRLPRIAGTRREGPDR